MLIRRRRGEGGRANEPDLDRVDDSADFLELMESFDRLTASVEKRVGPAFVKRGPGKRYIHRDAELPFVVERLLSSHLLDEGGVVLERARPTICDMLEGLPPDDGGDRAFSSAKRPA